MLLSVLRSNFSFLDPKGPQEIFKKAVPSFYFYFLNFILFFFSSPLILQMRKQSQGMKKFDKEHNVDFWQNCAFGPHTTCV